MNLEIKNISKEFKNNNSVVQVLENINLKIKSKEIIVILGPSGCGKTTLLNLIAGLIKPDKGKILLEKKIIKGISKEIGMVFQEQTLFPWLTVEKNILFGLGKKAIEEKLIFLIGLNKFKENYPFMLSLGMQQRVAIARTLAVNPKILLMDEPFSALDEITKEKMHDLVLKTKKKTGITILFVTHDIEEALFLADKIYVMSKRPGKIKALISNPFPKEKDNEIKFSLKFIKMKKKLKELIEEEVN